MKTLTFSDSAARLAYLTAQIGKQVSVRNRADAESLDGSMVRFALHGKLEETNEVSDGEPLTEKSEWYLRAGESYHGPIGINFPATSIHEINESQHSGQIEIVLK